MEARRLDRVGEGVGDRLRPFGQCRACEIVVGEAGQLEHRAPRGSMHAVVAARLRDHRGADSPGRAMHESRSRRWWRSGSGRRGGRGEEGVRRSCGRPTASERLHRAGQHVVDLVEQDGRHDWSMPAQSFRKARRALARGRARGTFRDAEGGPAAQRCRSRPGQRTKLTRSAPAAWWAIRMRPQAAVADMVGR